MMRRFLSVVCWMLLLFHLCYTAETGKFDQAVMIHCTKNCYSLQNDAVRIHLHVKVASGQPCYEECLRTFGKEELKYLQTSNPFKRFRRESPNTWTTRKSKHSQQDICTAKAQYSSCQNISEGHSISVRRESINMTVHKFGNTGRFYVNISWIPPPESVNWTGYKLAYAKGHDYDYYCCRDLNKTSTYAIADNSSYGFVAGWWVRAKVVALPLVAGKSFTDFQAVKVPRTDKPTEKETTPSPAVPTKTETTPSSAIPTKTETTPSSASSNTSRKEIIIFSSVVSSILVLLALLAYWFFHRKRVISGEIDEDGEIEYDAFIIYTSADEEWMKTTLLPILEEKNAFKCCIHYRDFKIGFPFRENMAKSVYKSRKIIAVLSRNFFESKYCTHELNIALGRLLEKGDNSVIVIKIDDFDAKQLPKDLGKRSYIDYFKSNDKETLAKQLIRCFETPVKDKVSTV